MIVQRPVYVHHAVTTLALSETFFLDSDIRYIRAGFVG